MVVDDEDDDTEDDDIEVDDTLDDDDDDADADDVMAQMDELADMLTSDEHPVMPAHCATLPKD